VNRIANGVPDEDDSYLQTTKKDDSILSIEVLLCIYILFL
jgi:hypothetical protein